MAKIRFSTEYSLNRRKREDAAQHFPLPQQEERHREQLLQTPPPLAAEEASVRRRITPSASLPITPYVMSINVEWGDPVGMKLSYVALSTNSLTAPHRHLVDTTSLTTH